MRPLSSDVYIEEPGKAQADGDGPQVVLVCGWMDAALPHVMKYTNAYKALFPAATVLLVRHRQSHFLRLASTMRRALEPAKDVLLARLAPPAPAGAPRRLLVHTFSNGGCISGMHLDELVRRDGAFPSGLPATCLVHDSCPGEESLRISVRAFLMPLSRGWRRLFRWPAAVLLSAIYVLLKAINGILGRPSALERMRAYFAAHFDGVSRLFLYSRTDPLIPAEAVEAHARLLEARGTQVELVRFDGTGHVNHIRGQANQVRYWRAVQDAWQAAQCS